MKVFDFRFSQKENLKKCTNFKEQKGTRDTRGNVYFRIIVFSCFSSKKACLRFRLTRFAREISFLENGFDFMDIMNFSPNILAKK